MWILQRQIILTHNCWLAVSLRSVAWGFFQGYSDFIAGLQLSSHFVCLLWLDSSLWSFLPTYPSAFFHGKYKVTIDCFHLFLPETVAAHRVVMDKLHTWIILLVGSTILSSTIPRHSILKYNKCTCHTSDIWFFKVLISFAASLISPTSLIIVSKRLVS